MRSRTFAAAASAAVAALAFAAPAAAQEPPADPDCQGERVDRGAAAAATLFALEALPAPGFSEFAPGGIAAFNQLVICAPGNR